MSEASKGHPRRPAKTQKDTQQKLPSDRSSEATGSMKRPASGRREQSNAKRRKKEDPKAERKGDKKAKTPAFPGEKILEAAGDLRHHLAWKRRRGLASAVREGRERRQLGGRPGTRTQRQVKHMASQARSATQSSRVRESAMRQEPGTNLKSKKNPSSSHQSMNAGHPQRGRGQKRKTPPQKAYAKPKQKFKRRSPTEPRTSRSPHLTLGDMRALAKRDPVKILQRLSRSIKGLQKILNQKIMLEDDIFCDVITVVGKACEAPSAEQLNAILAALKNTTFLGEGIKHYLQRRHLGNETSEKLDMGILRDLIKLFSTYLHRLPSSFADVPIEEMENTFEVLEFDGKDDILGRLAKLKEERNQAIKEHREKTKPQKRRHLSQGPPPEDFREIPIRPSVEEVASDWEPFLRKHIMKGRFDSPEHYLDVQFRLLREDFVYPLRKGLAEVVNNTPRHLREERMKLYNGVKILKKDYTRNGIVFKVQFNANPFKTTNWNSSKRLIFGSFLCISKDNFKTMIFATVANRDPDELKRGQLDIQFLEDQDVYGIEERNDTYVMAESPTYFESCRHVLSGLQNMDEESLPFKKYLVNCSSDVNPPEYLRREEGQEPVHYDLTQVLKIPRKTVEVLQPEDWPCADDVCLNSSQLQAFQAALTKEFCVIQGPPGTGKTYVGAKIVECLLKNRRFWDPDRNSPMLMVCYTNHALDQFLEKVLDFLPAGIIRVGSRSKNENLARFNLKSSVRAHYNAAECGRDESIEEIRDKEDALDRLERCIPNFEQLEGIMNARHACQFHKDIDGITESKDAFKVWICNKDMNIPVRSTNQAGGDGCLRRGTIGRPQKEENDDTEDQYTNAVEDHDHKQRSEDGKICDDVEYQWPDRYTPCYTTESTPETLASTPGTRGENVREFAYVLQTASKSLLPPPIGVRDAVISSTVIASVENSTHDRPPLEKGSSILIGLSEQSCQSMTTTQLADLSNKERMTYDEYEPQMEMNEDETNPEQPGNESSTQPENPGKSSLFTTSQHSDAVVPSCSAQEFFWLHEGTDDNIKTEPREPENPLEELETIDIDHQADVLQKRRYLAGEEEDSLPLTTTRSKKEGHSDDGEEDEEYVVIDEWQADPSCSAQEFFWLHEGTDDNIKTEPREPENPLEELETIDIEHEAHVLQRRRYLAGEEEDFLPLTTTRSKKEGHYDDGEEDEKYVVINDWQADPSSEPSDTARLTCLSTGIETPGGDGIEHLESNRSLGDDSDQRWQIFSPSKREHKSKKPTISAKDMANAMDSMKQKQAAMPAEEATQIEDVWSLQANDRRRLYWYWMSCYRQKCIIDIREEEKAYECHCKGSKRVKNEEEERALRRATVIGMTTTGAARYHHILRRIQPKIVVIEEAAEVLEAHIVTSLTPGTQHVIMIGDHKQLRPKATVYELAQKYNLQISLFERMVLNEMDCKRLSTQHRMRPEIAELTKRIYNHEITDHESVFRFQDVRGLQENLFFVDHQFSEEFVPCLQSYSNKHEADFIVALCHYLLLQRYEPEQITVLTMYTGQLLELKRLMPRKIFEGVRISVVDNFQGEENDIILLSLVRSSTIGFLKESNRICVALSRAREGFYCVGHFTLLTSNCQLWKDICEEMKTKEQMGTTLKLTCEKHHKSVDARLPEDFRKFPHGGCGTVCDDRLECGHVCGEECHPRDPSHRRHICRKICLEKCPNGHTCNKVCHHPGECDVCTHMVTTVLPYCGHETETECSTDVAKIFCKRQCKRILPCKHHCQSICGEACERRKCRVKVTKVRNCGHEALLSCHRDPSSAVCVEPVEATLSCGHVKRVQCHKTSDPGDCDEMCEKELICGHPCPGACKSDCTASKCMVLVEKWLPCGHLQDSPCGSNKTICQSACGSPCSRGHPCKKRCHAGSKCKECTEVEIFTFPDCGHQRLVQCHVDTTILVCQENCSRTRRCGHKCSSKCGDPCDASPCAVKVRKALPCTHEVELQCHVDPGKYACDVMVDRDLQCGHQIKAECHLKQQEIICKAIVETQLKCGHLKTMNCMAASKGLDVPCDVKVQKPLPCGHHKDVQCSRDVSREVCKLACGKTLECGHRCQENCGKACRCKKKTKKFLPCDHYAFLECCENVQSFPCPMKCKRLLKCGHACPGKCFEICAEQLCQERVTKCLRCPHQHRYILPCHKDASVLQCPTEILISLSCGHLARVPCFQAAKVICQMPCTRRRPCNHRCRGLCSEPCSSSPCKEGVNRQLRCGHIVTMQCCDSPGAVKCPAVCGLQLACGHTCIGNCSDCVIRGYHEVCQRPCTRKLVCSHWCRATCGVPCPPCAERCERRCEHRKCNNRCMADCAPCPMPCEKKCFHTQCDNLCSESCARIACDAPCLESLSCRHPCIGLCGQNCPTLCRKCHASALETSGSNTDKKSRFVQLIDCAHVIEVRRMDEWMQRPLTNVQLRQCPHCMNPVRNSPRYGNIIKQSFKDVLSVIHEAEEAAVAVEESIEFLAREIKMFGRRPCLMNFPDYVQNLVEPMFYIRGVRKCTHLEYLYSCKNHLEIMRDISATLYHLEPTAITFLCVKEKLTRPEQSGVEFILGGWQRALEGIEELISLPQFNLGRLSILHNVVRKFQVAVQFIDARCALADSGKRLDRPGEAKVRDQMQRVASLVRGRPEFVDLQKLLDVVNDLRTRTKQLPLSMPPPVRLVNFPGFSRDSWFKCEKGHVYATQRIVCDVTETEVRECRLCASQT